MDQTVIGFYGKSDSGKTSLIEKIIKRLNSKGLKVATIKSTDKKTASQAISILDGLSKSYGKKISEKVFLSDEFYLISGRELPSFERYKDFPQINNGIGKSVDFLNDIKSHLEKKKDTMAAGRSDTKILVISSEYGSIIIKKAIKMLCGLSGDIAIRYDNVSFDIMTVKNKYFGGNVKVTGLLTGSDLLNNIEKEKVKDYTSILIPDSIFNDDGLTLDGYCREDIYSLGENISIIGEDGNSFLSAIDSIAGV